MINDYETKPLQTLEFDGINEAEFQTWMEGFGYTATVSVDDGVLQLFVRNIGTTIYVRTGDLAIYWVSQVILQPISASDLANRFDLIP